MMYDGSFLEDKLLDFTFSGIDNTNLVISLTIDKSRITNHKSS